MINLLYNVPSRTGLSISVDTAAELALMDKVKAILVDEDWFQVYDNLAQFTEKFIASGLRWNYFYHTWNLN